MYYATSLKVAGSRSEEENEFCSVYLILADALGPQPLTEISARSRKIMCLGNKARPVSRADNLAAICEPFVYTMWDI
jgi:DNA-binding SARP family transcriptional activator